MAAGYGNQNVATVCAGLAEKSTSTASTPSRLVPDISPITNFAVMNKGTFREPGN
jgi:hypothetical protein